MRAIFIADYIFGLDNDYWMQQVGNPYLDFVINKFSYNLNVVLNLCIFTKKNAILLYNLDKETKHSKLLKTILDVYL